MVLQYGFHESLWDLYGLYEKFEAIPPFQRAMLVRFMRFPAPAAVWFYMGLCLWCITPLFSRDGVEILRRPCVLERSVFLGSENQCVVTYLNGCSS
jgi:hypothetical protein